MDTTRPAAAVLELSFMLALQIAGWALGLPLEILLISALLREHYRRYPLFFLYIVAEFLATVMDVWLTLAARSRTLRPGVRVQWYWINEGVVQFLLFALVISLIYHATTRLRSRRLLRTVLIVGGAAFTATSFSLHYPASVVSAWMTPWTRDLKFVSAILDLALWAMLIASREKDKRLLIISGTLGIEFAGEAIGEAIRALTTSHKIVFIGNVVLVAVNLAVLYIWWQTFRQPPKTAPRK